MSKHEPASPTLENPRATDYYSCTAFDERTISSSSSRSRLSRECFSARLDGKFVIKLPARPSFWSFLAKMAHNLSRPHHHHPKKCSVVQRPAWLRLLVIGSASIPNIPSTALWALWVLSWECDIAIHLLWSDRCAASSIVDGVLASQLMRFGFGLRSHSKCFCMRRLEPQRNRSKPNGLLETSQNVPEICWSQFETQTMCNSTYLTVCLTPRLRE